MTNLLNSVESQILTALMEGIVTHNATWGTRQVADILVYVETVNNGFKFVFVAGLEYFATTSYKNAVMALKTALTPKRDAIPAYHLQ